MKIISLTSNSWQSASANSWHSKSVQTAGSLSQCKYMGL